MAVEALILWGLIAYFIGSVPSGYVLVRLFLKKDVRHHGSGNIGATNVLRIGNRKLALLTYILDVVKVWVPMFLFNLTMNPIKDLPSDVLVASLMIVGVMAVMGHMYSCWLRFDGGKGVATFMGYFVWLFPYGALVGGSVFLIVVFATKIVSLASLVAVLTAAIYVVIYIFPTLDMPMHLMWVSKSFFIVMIILIFFRHKDNIRRLIKGEENKLNV
jgi:glycerol-3-phosphate acyltransferase PlsY